MRGCLSKWMSAALLAGMCLSTIPAQAGLFDFFFQRSAPQSIYEPQPEYGNLPFGEIQGPRHRVVSHPHITVVNKEGLDLSLPSGGHADDLMNDRTLREGDAVMTDQGLRIFAGASHGTKEFARLKDAKGLPAPEQEQLAEINVQRAGGGNQLRLDSARPPEPSRDKVVSGRSTASDTRAWKWLRDPRGHLIRYVGP
jgi:hypothetical protein